MYSKVKTVSELDTLVKGNIIHQTEADWLAKGIDNGYKVSVQIDKEKDGKFPFVLMLMREGDIEKKTNVKKTEAKIIGIDGLPLTPTATRAKRRAAYREMKRQEAKDAKG